MPNKILLAALLAIAGTGCTTEHVVTSPDGKTEHLISCVDEMFCEQKAADICDGSYKVMKNIDHIEEGRMKLLVKCEAGGTHFVEE